MKNSIENREAKELICTNNGHELSGESWRAREEAGRGEKGEKGKNCNSIISKIYLKTKTTQTNK